MAEADPAVAKSQKSTLQVSVRPCPPSDANRGIVWVAPDDLCALGLTPGQVVAIGDTETKCAYARAVPSSLADVGAVLLDGIGRDNAGLEIGAQTTLRAVTAEPAKQVTFAAPADVSETQIRKALSGHAITAQQHVWLSRDGRNIGLSVEATEPKGVVILGGDTAITLSLDSAPPGEPAISFEDIGGLGPELERIREMVELPLRRPELFARIGITPPKGILLSGPPGCGKTLIARAVARETKAAFFSIAGPEVADKHFGESEAKIREIFEAAYASAPAIIFIDEIESIAPHRSGLSGDRQVERRMVAQLLTLMDGLDGRGEVVVLAATNLPDLIDPALRRPGRFDREIQMRAPDEAGRREIIGVHTRTVPLAADVDIAAIAKRTNGFVGADLAALVREAGMAALRRSTHVPIKDLMVGAADFDLALLEVSPSILRSVNVEVPQVAWTAIAGLAGAKQQLRQAVEWPLKFPEHFARLRLQGPKGVLMYGPPGTGKTLLARAVATAANANFIAVKGGELLSMYLGESERAVRDIFKQARQTAPTVLFFDELDALAPARSERMSETSDRVVAQLLTELDGIEPLRGVLVLAATNRPDRIDPALRRSGRFDVQIEIAAPTTDELAAIFAVHLEGIPHDPALDLEALAAHASGMTGADVESIVRQSGMACLEAALSGAELTAADQLWLKQAEIVSAIDAHRRRPS
jgi:transitional endoplasmic reticulum ATPase